MALQYGFNYLGYSKDNKKWDKKFKELSEKDKDFYHNNLPWLLMSVDISHVSKRTIPIIIERSRLHSIFKEGWKEWLTPEYLERFIGFETNVGTKTKRGYLAKVMRILSNNYVDDLKSKKTVEKEFNAYLLEVHGRERKMMYN